MKRNIVLCILAAIFFACEEEKLPGDGKHMPEASDAIPVKFNMELESQTEYVPMSRAAEAPRYLTLLKGPHAYILLKLVAGGWYIDRIGNWVINDNPYVELMLTASTPLSPLSLELRPGTYRLAVCLNETALVRNREYKEGSWVADSATAESDFPCLWTYLKNSRKGGPLLSREPFSGYVEFRVEKNTDLHTEEPAYSFVVPLTRKVAQFQFMMKDTPERVGNIHTTAYWLEAKLEASGKPFCEGLNVLGLPYFNKTAPCRELVYYGSTMPVTLYDGWRTDKGGRQYQTMERGSTDPAYFWLADPADSDGVPFKVHVIMITGSSPGFRYKYDGEIQKVLKANQACGVAFESSGNHVGNDDWELMYAQLARDTTDNHVLEEEEFLFPPYYLWNQDMFVEEKKN